MILLIDEDKVNELPVILDETHDVRLEELQKKTVEVIFFSFIYIN